MEDVLKTGDETTEQKIIWGVFLEKTTKCVVNKRICNNSRHVKIQRKPCRNVLHSFLAGFEGRIKLKNLSLVPVFRQDSAGWGLPRLNPDVSIAGYGKNIRQL